ncbi:MAG: hypothetical protein KC708_20410, partial [Anaerolineae bacterium]|nr:hypothetical protein [Anaerolineae bacterium]
LVITPVKPSPIKRPACQHLIISALILLTVGLVLGAVWAIPMNRRYMEVLQDHQSQPETNTDYADLLMQLDTLIDQDPENRTYRVQYAIWAGELAYQTDAADDIATAIRAHQALLELVPQYGIGWSNLAGLYWQAGDIESALQAAEYGLQYAEHWPVLQWQVMALSGQRRFPLPIYLRPYFRYERSNLKTLYLRDLEEPLMLPQIGESLAMPRNELSTWLTAIAQVVSSRLVNIVPQG